MKRSLSILSTLAFIACSNPSVEESKKAMQQGPKDYHSFAKPVEAKVKHLNWDAEVDFDARIIKGTATYQLELAADANEVIFDTDELKIISTQVDGNDVAFKLGPVDPMLGRSLSIPLSPEAKEVTIKYESTPSAKALFWAEAEQTAGKEHPFLFTQSQAILARTWLPCQDSPGIRFTYNAKVKVPKDLLALMSAENPTKKNNTGVSEFKMKQAIPAYLMALTVGDLEFASIGNRTGVYAEPELIDESVYEFGEMDKMLAAAENLYGPYAWERYDLIVLPPSFPFGGMENPRLTFCTPTIIAGDRSLTALVAHELAHSWSGNLVTNSTWDDFWLNEGFTVYFERRIMEELYGKSYADMLAALGYQDLQNTLNDLEHDHPHDTHLKLNLKGRNPDDGMTDIAYEKGYFMLRTIEEKVGRERFDTFLRNYFNKFAFKVMNTEQFLNYLNENLLNGDVKLAQELALKKWIYQPGIPENAALPSPARFQAVEAELNAFLEGEKQATELNTDKWVTHEWLHFLNEMPKKLSNSKLSALDEAFQFTQSGNAEILCAWFKITIPNKYAPADKATEDFLIKVGRRKFLTPLYRAMKESNRLDWAKEIYEQARPGYHAVSTQTIDELLNYKPEENEG